MTLQPAPFFEAVNVTSSRTDVARVDPTSTVTVISSSDLLTSGPLAIDDALKTIPGSRCFGRTSSRNSNPTSQGVALRGIGGTSPSRSLVLADGVPLNDAFGGWVFWDKVPQAAIDRIEVDRGSGGDLYGADALGGVVQLVTVQAEPAGGSTCWSRAAASAPAACRCLAVVVLAAGDTAARGEWFTTDGLYSDRGEAEPRHRAARSRGLEARIDAPLGARRSRDIRPTPDGDSTSAATSFRKIGRTERRSRSTTPTSRHGSADVTGKLAGGVFTLQGYGGTQQYHQTFTTVNALRTARSVHSRSTCAHDIRRRRGGQWVRAWGGHTLLVGAEGRYVKGKSVETPFSQGLALATTAAGGTDRRKSGFVQDTWQAGNRLTIVLGAHGDTWSSKSNQTGFSKVVAGIQSARRGGISDR